MYLRDGRETSMQRMDMWTQQGEERVEQLETVTLKYVYHHALNR